MRIVQIVALWAWVVLWAGVRADMCDRRDRRNLRGWKGDVGDLHFFPGGTARDRLQLHHRVRRFLSFPTGSVLTVTPKLTIPWYSELNGDITGSQLYAFPIELNLPNSTLRFATRDRRPMNMYGSGMSGGSSSTSSSSSSSATSSSSSDTTTRRPIFGGLDLNRFDDSVYDHNGIYGSASSGESAYGYAGAYPHTGMYGSMYAHPYGSGGHAYGQGSAYGASGSNAYAHGDPYSNGDGSAYAHGAPYSHSDGSTYAHGAHYGNTDDSTYTHYSNSDGSTYAHGVPYSNSDGSASAPGTSGEDVGAHEEPSHAVYSRSIDDQRATGFTFLMKIMDNLGLDGRACLLRAVCEVAEEPIADLGITGEVVNLFFSAGFGSGDGQLAEFARAEERGRREGGCGRLYPACPHRLMELVTASMSYFHHGLAHVGKAGDGGLR